LVGIEIGGTKLQIVQGDAAGHIHRRWRATVDRSRGGPGILEQLTQGLRELGGTPRAMAVGFGGPVDHRTGRIRTSHQIEGWDDFALADWLAERMGTPAGAVVENDANTAALGEAMCGAGAGGDADPLFYVTLGSGVGGGLVAGGRIYHGASPGEAEFGHLRLDRDGATVESRCSGWAVDARIRRLREEEPNSLLARNLPSAPGGEAKLLAPALAAGDPAAGRVVREVAADLAFPTVLDGGGEKGIFRAYGIGAVPALIVIDKDGRVVRRFHQATDPEFDKEIQRLLAERPRRR
jgi:glucokinase